MSVNETDLPQSPLVSHFNLFSFIFSFFFFFISYLSSVEPFSFLLCVEKIKSSKGNLGEGFGEDYELWLRTRQQIKPEDQLELTEVELLEDVVKTLDTENSCSAKNLVVYSFLEKAYVPVRVFFFVHSFSKLIIKEIQLILYGFSVHLHRIL